MEQYYPRIDKLISEKPSAYQTAIFATAGGCLPIPHVVNENDHGIDRTICNGFTEFVQDKFLNDPEVNTVVI
ncbi:hypothetical protein ABTD44_21530, partial [Acinetobacter baumannii]